MKKMLIGMIVVAAFAGSAFAADVMEFKASMGAVKFDHKKHQDLVKDCKVCHEKGPGKIEGFGKDYAHGKGCKGCHETKKQGPTKCPDCHKKS
jgi:opacity protein-like surface antigen